MLTTRTQRWFLIAATLVNIAGGAALVRWTLKPTGAAVTHKRTDDLPLKTGATSPGSDLPPLSAYESAWGLSLQRPLYDPPPVVVEAPPAPPPTPPAIRLTGTVVEPGRSVAFIRDRAGNTMVSQVGDVVDGVELLTIEELQVSVRFESVDWRLPVGKEPVR